MPALATKQAVLDGRAKVVSYARNPAAFFIRVLVPGKRSYRTRRIDGVSTPQEAIEAALDAFMEMGAVADAKPPRRGTKPGTKITRSGSSISKHLADHYLEQEQKYESGLIKASTLKNKKETLFLHLDAYLKYAGISRPSQVKVGAFDRYQVWRIESNASKGLSQPSNLTLKKESAIISGFIGYLSRHRLLDPYEAANKQDISPKIRLSDTDFDSNPPIRDLDEWKLILQEVRRWVKESASHPRPRNYFYRRMFWTLLLVLKQTGMRPDEARRLRWKDIEVEDIGRFSKRQWEEDMAFMQSQGITECDLEQLEEYDREAIGRVSRFVTHIRILHSKTKSTREVTSNSAEALARWKQWQSEYLLLMQQKLRLSSKSFSYRITEDDLVFAMPEANGVETTSYNTFNINWRKIIDRCGSKLKGPLMSDHQYTIYSLRSSRAQELMDMGVDVYLAATQLGHTVAMLEKVYARLPQRRRATKEAAHIDFGKRSRLDEMVSLEFVQAAK